MRKSSDLLLSLILIAGLWAAPPTKPRRKKWPTIVALANP